ncbi:MAG TPA: hydroxymethylglutaryl-CoA synthase [Candidatus Lokiarchaeia archaeon]|nr:hydroxymethylglutaryl-CoA synthase [Candidatus Lokiarchaeia archaeon]
MNENFFLNVGIDAIGFYAPRNRLSLDDLAKKRGVDPDKYRQGLLSEEFCVPDYGEDAISMAIMAAKNAINRGNIDSREIEAIFVGSESLPYAVKSIASILSAFLNIQENAFTGDTLHACAGATLGLLNAVGLINSGIIKKALVIGTDISKYPLGSPGEPTQGAGAAAMVISENPRIARIGSKFGKVSGHVDDFFRTLYSENAEVFGQYSTMAYLNFVLKAYDDFKNQVGSFLADYYVFHAPFGKMPIKSFQRIMFDRWCENPDKMKAMLDKATEREYSDKERELILSGKEELQSSTIDVLHEKGFTDDEILGLNYFYKDWLALKLMPCLDVPMRFGNCYSASLWAQLFHLIETRVKENDTIYFTSYGSGATAISGMFKIQPGFEEVVAKGPTVLDYIKKKSRIPIENYEMYKRDLLPGFLHVGQVEAAPENESSLDILMCDYGCVLPVQEELQHCPMGHPGVHKHSFPMLGVVTSIDEVDVEIKDHVCLDDGVYLLGDITAGSKVELAIRRLKVDEDSGLIHWYPTYVQSY